MNLQREERTNDRNPLRRFCKFSWAMGSHGGAGRLQHKCRGGSKLRGGRVVDLSHVDRQIHTWNRVSGVRKLKLQICATSIAISRQVISQ
jgi:hypothetical protein